jgi:hypothetical protein
MGDGTSAAVAAAHCVRSEEFAVVLEKNVDPGRRTRGSVQREWLTFLSGVSYLYSSMAARPG